MLDIMPTCCYNNSCLQGWNNEDNRLKEYSSYLLNLLCHGSIAQLGEHLPYKQGVTGSSPVGPTKCRNALWNTFPKMIASQQKTMFPSGTQSKINTPMWLNSGLLTLSIRGEQSREAWLCQLSRKVDKK